MLADLKLQERSASAAEQAVLGRWAGWGALPAVFDEGDAQWSEVRQSLHELLGEFEWDAARRTTINAHYTSAEVVGAIWTAVVALGFEGGRVLEPGCGSGNFIGLAPPRLPIEMVGVELDPTTARIAEALYPGARIGAEGFERSRFPTGWFDLTVGNVPFGRIVLHDPVHNAGRHSIHNHFIVKALHLTRPGGLVAVVTSRFTLDARNPAARREMAERADLVGAVRLPAGAFQAAAGTEAVTDVLILRRREPGQGTAVAGAFGQAWERVVQVATPDGQCQINEFLASYPHLVLGELRATRGQYSESDLTVRAKPGPLDGQLREALASVVERAVEQGLVWSARSGMPSARDQLAPSPPPAEGDHQEGSIVASRDGGFAQILDGESRHFEVSPRKDRRELAVLLSLRDVMVSLLEAQASTHDDGTFAAAQTLLNRRYDEYVAGYGPLNRFSLVRTGRVDPRKGVETYRRLRPAMGGFRLDPAFHAVMALEVFDADSQTARKAPVFSGRVIGPREPRRGAESAQDALAICLDEHAKPDLKVVAELLGVDEATARAELADLVWDDPASGQLVPAPVYLAGNVRSKLRQAEAAAARDPRWAPNVAALQKVVPADLGPVEIDVRLGAPWISTGDVEAFVDEVLGCTEAVVDHAPVTATWAVSVPSWKRRTVAASSQWGTARADAVTLLQSSLNQRPATVYDVLEEGSRVLNAAETLAAREKQEALEARFSSWVWEEPTRARRLSARYNDLFNSTVLPSYDGSHLTTPGLARTFRAHPHQRDAVWRILQEPTTLLAHAVGAGKTATMVMAGMELRRLGLANRPAYVVPNHMLDQFAAEMLRLYPLAKVLVASRAEASRAGRKGFVARCAMGDWDAVVITQSAFERIPVSRDTASAFLSDRLCQLREAITESKGLTVKRLEARMVRIEERHKRLLAEEKKDDGVNFESTGIDYLFVDEAHAYKNREFATHIPGVGGEGSQRAEDLELKLTHLRARYGRRVATFATATPVANSLSEMYVMQAYLQPDTLASAGLDQFDAWAASFARTLTALELAPDGGSYRMHTRFSRFRNVPELLTMFHLTADVRTVDQLNLPVPAIAGGRPETVVVKGSPELDWFVATLVVRAESIRSRAVSPNEDNMLKISGDGRRAALDLRLVGDTPDPSGGKISAAAQRVAAIHADNRNAVYQDPTGEVEHRRGALQLVFCDLGTPREQGWSVYEELREQLVVRGVPRPMVRFIHEAKDDRAKAELFAACRDGRVAVLVGSTEKMGVGTNVQTRLVALHHLDCPWRPADIEQREGRALRQGNQNSEVHVLRYVTEGSFDVYMWQTVERKAGFIHQVMQGRVAGREIDDVGDRALSYAEVKALATGDPLIMEKAGVDNEVATLLRLRTAHHQDQTRLVRTLASARTQCDRLRKIGSSCDAAIARRIDTRGDRFSMTVDGTVFGTRAEAGRCLKQAMTRDLSRPAGSSRSRRVGELGGFPIELSIQRDAAGTTVTLSLTETPIRLVLNAVDIHDGDPTGLVQRLENRIRGLDDARSEALEAMEVARREAAAAEARIGKPFDQQPRLDKLRRRQGQIERLLTPDPTTGSGEEQANALDVPFGEPGCHSEHGQRDAPARHHGAAEIAQLAALSRPSSAQGVEL